MLCRKIDETVNHIVNDIKQTRTKELQDKAWLVGKCDPQRIVQETKIWIYYQMVYTQTRIYLGEYDT